MINTENANKQVIIVAIGIILITILGIAGWQIAKFTSHADSTGTLPEGAIALPNDLVPKFNSCVTALEAADVVIRTKQAEAMQILRITMDRAGVNATEFDKYEYDKACVCVKKKKLDSTPTGTPTAPPIR